MAVFRRPKRIKRRKLKPTPTPPPVAIEERAAREPDSLASLEVEPPRSSALRRRPGRLATITVLVGIALVLVAYVFRNVDERHAFELGGWRKLAALIHRAKPDTPKPQAAAPSAAVAAARADAHLNRTLKGNIPGGVVFVPSTFASEDGAYDLLLHFHGNTGVVKESAEYAGLNAIVAIVNLGINSAPYLDAYAVPGTYEQLLEDINHVVAQKGLEHPHLRRLALSSWSGGYGAISMILEQRKGNDPLDAIAVMDGIHCGYLDDGKTLNVRILMPFTSAAKRAAKGDFLFTITHSEVDPGTYAGTKLTAQVLVDEVGGSFGPPKEAPEHVNLKAAEGAVSKKLEKWMEPYQEVVVGSFHVRGFRGATPEHHMAHLLQMGATVLPEIAARWASPHP